MAVPVDALVAVVRQARRAAAARRAGRAPRRSLREPGERLLRDGDVAGVEGGVDRRGQRRVVAPDRPLARHEEGAGQGPVVAVDAPVGPVVGDAEAGQADRRVGRVLQDVGDAEQAQRRASTARVGCARPVGGMKSPGGAAVARQKRS